MEFYTVKPGDTINSIAQSYRVTPKSIADVNGFAVADPLVIGMNLVIPTTQTQPAAIYMQSPIYMPYSYRQPYSITQIKPVIETLGYYVPPMAGDKTALINSLGQYLTYIGLFDFPITSAGEITGTIDQEILSAAKAKNSLLLPVLTNLVEGEFSSELGRIVLSNPNTVNTLINNIMQLLSSNDLKGVVIDFEHLYPEDRNLFTNFIRMLSERLHSQNKLLVLNMAPKWEDAPEREWVGFFDYNALGRYVDIAAIMTYEWGYRSGPPSPTAPIPFIKRVLDYAISQNIPSNNIMMGMTLYGYDWALPYNPANLANTVSLPNVWDLGRKYNAPILFDSEVAQPHMNYTNENGIRHEVWFEDALSHYYKYLLVQQYNLRGVFYWTINLPFTATWYILSNIYTIKKL